MSSPKPGMETAKIIVSHVELIREKLANMVEMGVMTEAGNFSDLIGRVVRFYFTNRVCESAEGDLRVVHVGYTIYGNKITYTIRKLPFRDQTIKPADGEMLPYLSYLQSWDNLLKLS